MRCTFRNELMGFMEKKGYTVENMGCDSTEDSIIRGGEGAEITVSSGYQARCADLRLGVGHGRDCPTNSRGHPRRRLP